MADELPGDAVANPHFDPARIAKVRTIVDKMARLLVAEHRAHHYDGHGNVPDLLTHGVWTAAQTLGRDSAASVQMADAPEEDILAAGTALLVRGRPGSWEADAVMTWAREGDAPGYANVDRCRHFAAHLIELIRLDPPGDVGDLLSRALGQAATTLGSADALIGYSGLYQIEGMVRAQGPQPA